MRRWSMACPALPTCGLSITESERALPGMIDELEGELRKLGLQDEKFTVRMTGCPNGCARPYNSDIGLVGKAKGKYTVREYDHILLQTMYVVRLKNVNDPDYKFFDLILFEFC